MRPTSRLVVFLAKRGLVPRNDKRLRVWGLCRIGKFLVLGKGALQGVFSKYLSARKASPYVLKELPGTSPPLLELRPSVGFMIDDKVRLKEWPPVPFASPQTTSDGGSWIRSLYPHKQWEDTYHPRYPTCICIQWKKIHTGRSHTI